MSKKWAVKISLTDRCNFRCYYCIQLPQILAESNSRMNLDTIEKILVSARSKGIEKVLWTGGEPTLGPIIEASKLARELNFREQGITSNGFLLNRYLNGLIENGLTRANISIDSLCEDNFRDITKTDKLQEVMQCIRRCCDALELVKINMVVMRSNLHEIADFLDFQTSVGNNAILKLHEMWEAGSKAEWEQLHVPATEIKERLLDIGSLSVARDVNTTNPGVEYYAVSPSNNIVGIAQRPNSHVCKVKECTKLRIYPNGRTCEGRDLFEARDWANEFEELMETRWSNRVENNAALSDRVGLRNSR